ncbi:histidine--tRNA ligase [Candidatus Kuenenbacteria bacterium HGW-Kuenenbacteria-1]|uniref:Histidine--tRNA ligase n=1 Tax=Candidatus Kuenenbacteria bacterium HGW-Kuenenbacteria-1 TaxID=2013812 RepID=A0A2N1UMZ1_9BACT|nr:MAG: histidine--tRNA ligase [Candidatus Kuenenbacteria bacterium HGW-Kuenenbacteria-1]
MPRKPKRNIEEKIIKKEKIKPIHILEGMKDILPEKQLIWQYVIKKAQKIAQEFNFKRIDIPVLEELSLFEKSIGKTSDIIQKQKFSLITLKDEKMILRPELTTGIVRAYVEHNMFDLPQPIKLYTIGSLFRDESSQSGKLRELHSFNFEILGEKDSVIDAQIILLSQIFFQELNLKTNIQINSFGCLEDRQDYKKELLNYFKNKKKLLCSNCKLKLNRDKDIFKILDCKEEDCQKVINQAPQLVNRLCEGCKNHFTKVLEHLDELDIAYSFNPYLIPELDYYTRTVFEIFIQNQENKEDNQKVVLGKGGRYNNLVEILGGNTTSACGCGIELEKVVLKIEEQNSIRQLIDKKEDNCDVFIAQLGETAKRKALKLFENFRKSKIKVIENLAKNRLSDQLELAQKHKAIFTLILGQKEVLEGTILIRDMESGIQEAIDIQKIIPEITKRLEKKKKEMLE